MITLQHVIPPQQGLCTEPELYYRLEGQAFARDASGEFLLEAGAGVRFDTYFNLLSIGKWHAACRIEGLHLVLTGQGQMEVRAFLAVPDRSWERLCCEIVTLDPETETRIDLSHYALNDTRGVIWFEVRALAPRRGGRLIAARFEAPLPEGAALPKLAVLVPETDRPVEADDEDAAEFPARARMMRARLAEWAKARGATVIADDDAAAALSQAVAGGATHVIRVDPRAVLSAESLDRVRAFLALAASPDAALTASDLHVTEKWRSGAILRTAEGTDPLFQGADLRDLQEVMTIEHETILIESGSVLPHRDFLAAAVNPATGGLPAKPDFVTLNGLALLPTPEESVTSRLAVLQELMFPVQGISTEQDLFFHLTGAAGFQSGSVAARASGKTGTSGGGAVTLAPGAQVLFDSYFNAFSLAKWHGLCRLDGLFLAIRGTGRVEVKVFHAIPDRSWEQLVSEVVTLSRSRSARFDLSHYVLNSTDGVIYFEVRCVDRDRPASVTAAEYLTRAPRGGKTAATQLLWLPEPPKPGEDNAQELALDATMRERITAWAREAGVRIVTSDTPEALDRHLSATRPTHLVKANPGALFLPGMLDRAFAFLRLTRDPSVALTASTFHRTDRFRAEQIYAQASAASRRLSELGLRARPMLPDMDLRDRAAVLSIESETAELPAELVEAQPDFLAITLPAGSGPAAVNETEGRRILPLNGLILVPAPEVVSELGLTTLQGLIFPERGISTERDLFFRLAGSATFHDGAGQGAAARAAITLDPGGSAFFDTYFNALSIGKWHGQGGLNGLFLGLRGTGRLEIKVFHAIPDRSWELLASEVVSLSRAKDTILDLSHYVLNGTNGVIFFEVRAVDPVRSGTITDARFLTRGEPTAVPVLVWLSKPPLRAKGTQGSDAQAQAADAEMRARITAWARASGAQVVTGAVAAKAALARAAATGAHVLRVDPGAVFLPAILDRAVAFLGLGGSSPLALTASTFHQADRYRAGQIYALEPAASSRPGGMRLRGRPMLENMDLRDRATVLFIEGETAELEGGTIEPQADFLAFTLRPGDTLDLDDPAGAGSLPAVAPEAGLPALPSSTRILPLNGMIVVPAPSVVADEVLTTLQHLIFPEQGICTEQDLFFHMTGAATFQGGMGAGAAARPTITLDPGGAAFFDTYFNALSIGKWHAACDLDGLFLGLRGSGRLEVKVFHAIPDRSWELLVSEVVGLSRSRDTILDLSHYVMNAVNGVIYFEVRAVDPVRPATITGARYMTRSLPAEDVNLAVSITTFKREEQVESTAARLHAFLETSDFKGRVQVFVVDNGKSAEILQSPHITVIPNANLGGAGGFSRGLVEAEARGISHVLFMDDDASILMENIHRAFAFFALATDKKVAIAGAMINNSDKWRMWENGAVFDQKCMPLFSGLDLRTREGVMHLEFESHRRRPDKMYGGWWFFAFPVAQVSRHPFPFFVRGDDVNFSLVNDFHITTLNGVVSFQDDFTDKESPLTWYLDLRSHMVHHLTLEKMDVGRLRLAHMGVWFYMRNVMKFQYETIDAVLLAWSHVLKGPDFFVQNADASGPRAQIKALTKTEAWKPISELDLTERRRFRAEGGLRGRLMKLLLNGQVVPFWNLIGNRVVVAPQDRGAYWPIWGASRITYLNSTREKGYTVTQSKRRFAGTMLRMIGLWLRMVLGYGALRAKYRRRYPEITTRDFWETTLGVSRAEADPGIDAEGVTIDGTVVVGAAGPQAEAGASGAVAEETQAKGLAPAQ